MVQQNYFQTYLIKFFDTSAKSYFDIFLRIYDITLRTEKIYALSNKKLHRYGDKKIIIF